MYIMKNDIIQGISLNVVLLASLVFVCLFSIGGRVVRSYTLPHVHLKQYISFMFYV